MNDSGLRRLVREMEAQCERASNDKELKALLEGAASELGFAFVGLVHHVSFHRDDPKLIHLDNYPQGWREEFVADQLFLDDPVLQASQRTAKGFKWSEVERILPVHKRHAHVMERSARYGMGPGFTVPGNVPGEPSASCSFAVKQGRLLPATHLRCAELIGIDLLDAARRIRRSRPTILPPHLSRRERQCLRLAAAGKSDWEIAQILGLSPETTRRYMKSARAAYDVVSRTQLVVHALRDGQISFDDAIPPFG